MLFSRAAGRLSRGVGLSRTMAAARKDGRSSLETLPFFVYGTLRDDDDSGAPWTVSFVKDASVCESVLLRKARLYLQVLVPFAFCFVCNRFRLTRNADAISIHVCSSFVGA